MMSGYKKLRFTSIATYLWDPPILVISSRYCVHDELRSWPVIQRPRIERSGGSCGPAPFGMKPKGTQAQLTPRLPEDCRTR